MEYEKNYFLASCSVSTSTKTLFFLFLFPYAMLPYLIPKDTQNQIRLLYLFLVPLTYFWKLFNKVSCGFFARYKNTYYISSTEKMYFIYNQNQHSKDNGGHIKYNHPFFVYTKYNHPFKETQVL